MSSRIDFWSRRVKAPISRFSRTVMRGEDAPALGRLRDADLGDLVAGEALDVAALEDDAPVRGGTMPEIERSVVDFPAPLEPISVTISPSRTSIEMPLSASIEP